MKVLSLTITMVLVAMLFPLMAIGGDPSLMLYMPFEEGAGKTTADLSGTGNDGEFMGGVKWTGDGKYGNALEFNGVDSYVEIPSNDTLQAEADGWSIEAWIKADPGSADWARIVDKFYGTGYCIGRSADELFLGVEFDCPNSFKSTTPVFDNKWHHVALTREVGELKIYVDGVLESTIAGGSAIQHNQDTTHVRIGAGVQCCAEDEAVGLFYKGIIDEVAIYRKTLTEDEIKKDMEGIPSAVSSTGKLATTWANIKGRGRL